ncbi:hypothetical protein TNCV_328231 [Trichonephila clavipes]|nr:hypothetical protein TNCV_328231 [Trichonephila clavipes]
MLACCDKDIPWRVFTVFEVQIYFTPPYGIRGSTMELITDAPAYCLKEPMELGSTRGGPCADPLRSPIRDYWGRERGPLRGFKGSVRKLTRIIDRSSASFSRSDFILFRRHVTEVSEQPPLKDQGRGTPMTL